MPFYEYSCSHCGHHHEELQKVTDKPLKKCPECGRNTLKRLISAPVFRLKGGGWYETDFKSDKEAKRNLAGEKEHHDAKPDTADKPKATPAKAASDTSAKAATPAKPDKASSAAKKTSRAKPAASKAPAKKKPTAGRRAR